MKRIHRLRPGVAGAIVAAAGLLGVWGASLRAQVFSLTREELIELTSSNPYGRFPDGRPRIPDELLERARGLTSEEVMGNQFADGFQILHPHKKLVGRAFTAVFMPQRPELENYAKARGLKQGLTTLNNQTVIDMLGPGDVLVVDAFGKRLDGGVVGDNLFYYIMKATNGAGLVIDGSVRDLDEIAGMEMPLYFRSATPTWLQRVTLAGWNVPIRIGGATVLPGDLVVGDREGVTFIPPSAVEKILDAAETGKIRDEWNRKKFDEGKYKSSDIYSRPRDPELQKEQREYIQKRLDQIRKK